MGTATVTDPQSREIICNNCGMVITENLQDDARPEWRSFELEQDNINKIRIGKPLTLARHDIGPSTIIGMINRNIDGIEINPAICSQIERLRIWVVGAQGAAEMS